MAVHAPNVAAQPKSEQRPPSRSPRQARYPRSGVFPAVHKPMPAIRTGDGDKEQLGK